jgi:hypothetical protein
MTGPGAKFAPTPDKLTVSAQDPQFFTGSLWMMSSGSWQVRISVDGHQGTGVLAVPVPSVALSTKKMQSGMAVMLLALMTFLVAGVVAIVGASAREVDLAPGTIAQTSRKRRSRIAMAIAFAIVVGVLWFGKRWWDSSEAAYNDYIYKPLQMAASLDQNAVLTLNLSDPGWLKTRAIDDLVPDHDHLMHLYTIRQPGLDVVYHLHPELVRGGSFRMALPSMPPGTYKLYADIVHQTGFPETMMTTLQLPEIQGRPLDGDDATGATSPVTNTSPIATVFRLPDGYSMEWLQGSEPLRARQPTMFKFRLLDPKQKAPADMAFYMGMPGHAAFVKTDGTVFAHIHPTGTVAMAAFMMAEQQTQNRSGMNHAGMHHMGVPMDEHLPNEVSFPYGLPSPGFYRVFVQMKHGTTVETGIFDISSPS